MTGSKHTFSCPHCGRETTYELEAIEVRNADGKLEPRLVVEQQPVPPDRKTTLRDEEKQVLTAIYKPISGDELIKRLQFAYGSVSMGHDRVVARLGMLIGYGLIMAKPDQSVPLGKLFDVKTLTFQRTEAGERLMAQEDAQ